MPLDVIISNQKFLIPWIPNKTEIYRYLAFKCVIIFFSLFFSFLGYPVLDDAFFFPEIQHDGSISNASFPINSIKVAKDCLGVNEYLNLIWNS